jgi:hypothetical protein
MAFPASPTRRQPMRKLSSTVGFVLLLVGCQGSDDGPPTRDECARATSRLISMQVASMDLPGVSDADRKRHRDQLAASAGVAATDRCESTFDRAQFDCVMRAATSTAAYACSVPGPTVAQGGEVKP